ncbi:MAG: site-specific integrase [Actinomycetota bacterium]|nr:site-specific integrase [Actinomycetota bacterium]
MAKKANHEGSVYQRKDGRWEAVLTYRDGAGELKRRRSYHRSREEADRALTKMKAERDGGVAMSGDNPTLYEYLVAWLRDSVAVSVDPKTLEGYEVACRVHILPTLGRVRLKDLKARQIQALYAKKQREGLSVRTRRNVHATLKRALKQAVAWGELPASPAEMLDLPKAPAEEEEAEEIKALWNEEAEVLFAAACEAGDRFRNLYVVAVRTGLRQGELLALRWTDVNLEVDPAVLTLKRALASRIGGGVHYTPTKRKSQRRKLALHWEAADALRGQRELQAEEREKAGEKWREHGLVFPSSVGSPMSARNLYRRHFKKVLASTELPDVTFHDLRHTFASIMLYEWGTSPRLVQEMLGHASIKITMDTYSHLLPNAQDAEIRRLQRLFGGGVTGTLPSKDEKTR